MRAEALAALAPRDGGTYIDGTFGAGGYTVAILEAAATRVLAIDRDPDAIREGQALAKDFAPRLALVEGFLGNMERLALTAGFSPLDGIVLDLGLSSMQLDRAERGFSFQADGPLDMRMSKSGPSAADLVNEADERHLAEIIHEWGEERHARRIARAVVAVRGRAPILTTRQLASIVERVVGHSRDERRHPATRTFQALRIAVNDELHEVSRGIAAAERILKPGGRLVVISFHSAEDRVVKQFLARRAGRRPAISRHLPGLAGAEPAPSFRIVNQRPLTPSQGEIDANPRARSAKLRAAERTSAPPLLAAAAGDVADRASLARDRRR
jgi:16S rRNA (cytosine1402-N4)-methyltransferase